MQVVKEALQTDQNEARARTIMGALSDPLGWKAQQQTMSNLAPNGATYTSLFICSSTTRPSQTQVTGKHP